ncbi:hypothetical protein BH10PSE17_BH10PSE17_02870 [soil metagenome]
MNTDMFRLAAVGLTPDEFVVVEASLRLLARAPSFRWIFVDAAPADAVFAVDVVAASGAFGTACIIEIVDEPSPGRPTLALQRPLLPNRIDDRLRSIETLVIQERARLAQQGARLAINRELAAEQPGGRVSATFAMKRWPSQLLRGQREHQLCNLLISRPHSVRELVHATQIDRREIKLFLTQMYKAGHLQIVSDPHPRRSRPSRVPSLRSVLSIEPLKRWVRPAPDVESFRHTDSWTSSAPSRQ